MPDDDPGELDPEVERRLRASDPADLAWVRARIDVETARREAAGGGCGDTLYALAFLLFRIGEAADARRVRAAKHANFDCGCTIDRGLLTIGRDLDELRAALDPVADAKLLAEIADVIAHPDHDDLDAALARYFGV